MEIFSRLLHEKGKTIYDENFVEEDSSKWPAEWTTTYFKKYLRFPEILLPNIKREFDLFTAISGRKSERELSPESLGLEELSTLLKYSCGEIESTSENSGRHRAQPSGGARFPVEVYILLFRSESTDLRPGVYHYDVKHHSLRWLWEGGEMFTNKSYLMKSKWTEDASALIVMTSVFWRNQNKYKARGYRMICIEAGAIIQNIYLICKALKLKCTAYAGTNDDKIEELLDLDTEVESVIMSVVIGK